MNYQLDIKEDRFSLYSPKIGMYVMEDVSMNEVQVALAMEIEYRAKLQLVKMLMTFPDGFALRNGPVIEHTIAVKAYNRWHDKIYKKIGNLDEYYSLIDQQIVDLFKS